MALRLGDYVVRGEIFNLRPHSTHGWIELRGSETPLLFELTGDCAPDFRGKRVRFEADPNSPDAKEYDEKELKGVLSELALCGVAFHVCEHFTLRDAYRLLLERVLREDRAYSQLKGTGWVQGFMTSDYCPQCDAEAEARFQEESGRQDESE